MKLSSQNSKTLGVFAILDESLEQRKLNGILGSNPECHLLCCVTLSKSYLLAGKLGVITRPYLHWGSLGISKWVWLCLIDRFRAGMDSGHRFRSRGRGPQPDELKQGLDGAVVGESGKLGSDFAEEGTEAHKVGK